MAAVQETVDKVKTLDVDAYKYGFTTQILAASIRNANHVSQAALIGADVVTAPAAVLKGLVNHPLTDKGLAQFVKDWAATGQKIV